MDKLLSTIYPDPKTISPAALKKPQVSAVPDNFYLNRKLNFAIAPPHYQKSAPDCCTKLPPSPKDNIADNPACVRSACFPNRPFKRGKCYMLYSPQQNIWGPVCGDGGYNANWVRGNRFGVDYQYKKVFNRPDYAVDVPRFAKKNPVLVSDSPFYPFPDYGLRFDPKYKSYPMINPYIRGHPTINYPYSILNKNAGVKVTDFSLIENFCGKEHFFGGFTGYKQTMKTTITCGVLLVILVFLIHYFKK